MRRIMVLMIVAAVCVSVFGQRRLLGGDISLLPSYEAMGTKYMDRRGKPVGDFMRYLRRNRWNAIRVRLFVDPQNAPQANKDEGVCQDLDYVIALSRRVKEAGMQLMLDFHYSDTWADPAKQFTPKRWIGVSEAALADSVYAYTAHCLRAMNAAGCTPDLIQIGNEITFGMLWPTAKVDPVLPDNWNTLGNMLRRASQACRQQCPEARIIVHTEHAGEPETTFSYYQHIAEQRVDYDIIGLSYYPMWHKRLPVLSETLSGLALRQPAKEVMIVEAAFYYSHENDFWEKDPQAYSEYYPISPDGQRQFTEELVSELLRHDNVTGLFWWFPEENCFGNSLIKSWINRGLFDNRTGRELPAMKALRRFQ